MSKKKIKKTVRFPKGKSKPLPLEDATVLSVFALEREWIYQNGY